MKQVIVIWLLAILSAVGTFFYINWSIDQRIGKTQLEGLGNSSQGVNIEQACLSGGLECEGMRIDSRGGLRVIQADGTDFGVTHNPQQAGLNR